MLQSSAAGAIGLGTTNSLLQQALAKSPRARRAKSVILLFTWGGISHIDCWDLKPHAGTDIRGEFNPIATSVPGIEIGEHLPQLAQRMHHVALVRSVHHKSADHRKGAYWSLTGHPPTNAIGGVVAAELPSRRDWPCLGSQVAKALYRRRSTEELARAVGPADAPANKVEEKENFDPTQLTIVKTVSLSTHVLGPGHFSAGSFNKQDGYTNKGTVELIGMISAAAQAKCPLTRQADGPVGDFSGYIAGDSTAGDWGSDTHGRGGNLFLPGGGERDERHAGFGAHANKFITFDLDAVRRKHFGGRAGHLRLTGSVGVNGAPGVPPAAAIQGGVWVDGVRREVSPHNVRDDVPYEFTVYIKADSRWLTLAMLNGPESTWFDDVAFRDVNLAVVDGDLPDECFLPPKLEELKPTQMTDAMAAALPGTISIPYPLSDRGLLNGQYGGFLGPDFDPVFVKPEKANPYKGRSELSGHLDFRLAGGITSDRVRERRGLLSSLKSPLDGVPDFANAHDFKHEQALNMLMSPAVKEAFDLRREPSELREAYGNHVCGQSVLMARRLAEAGVPLITVNCSAGDLNGGSGDHFDTHSNNFNRLKRDLLPPYDRAASALLDDLAQRGRLDDILVLAIGDFGRTPTINGNAGRDHFPNVFSMWFAGGGIRGGQVYGSSDGKASEPRDNSCGPEDIHATVFHALGIDPHFTVHDLEHRPFPLTEGQVLPLFG